MFGSACGGTEAMGALNLEDEQLREIHHQTDAFLIEDEMASLET